MLDFRRVEVKDNNHLPKTRKVNKGKNTFLTKFPAQKKHTPIQTWKFNHDLHVNFMTLPLENVRGSSHTVQDLKMRPPAPMGHVCRYRSKPFMAVGSWWVGGRCSRICKKLCIKLKNQPQIWVYQLYEYLHCIYTCIYTLVCPHMFFTHAHAISSMMEAMHVTRSTWQEKRTTCSLHTLTINLSASQD